MPFEEERDPHTNGDPRDGVPHARIKRHEALTAMPDLYKSEETRSASDRFPSRDRLLRGRAAVTVCPGQDACGLCEKACAFGAIKKPGRFPMVDHAVCIGCAACVKACPHFNFRLVDGTREEGEATFKCRLSDLPETDGRVSLFDESGELIGVGRAVQAYPLPDGTHGIIRARLRKELLEAAVSAKK